MAAAKTQAAPSPTLKAYQDRISAQVQESKAKLQQLDRLTSSFKGQSSKK